jgi:hypothetical protein
MSDDRRDDTRVGLKDFLGAFVAEEVDMSEDEVDLRERFAQFSPLL